MMSGELRDWIADCVPKELNLALEWSRRRHTAKKSLGDNSGLEDLVARTPNHNSEECYEDDGSNLRVGKEHDIRESRPVQIIKFIDKSTSQAQAWVSDGQTRIFANFTTEAVQQCANQTGHRFSRTVGGIGNIRKLDIVATHFGPAETRISFYIREYHFLGSANSSIAGWPKSIHENHQVKDFLKRLEMHWSGKEVAVESEEATAEAERNERLAASELQALRNSDQETTRRQRQIFLNLRSLQNSPNLSTSSPSQSQRPFATQMPINPSTPKRVSTSNLKPLAGINIAAPVQLGTSHGSYSHSSSALPLYPATPQRIRRSSMTSDVPSETQKQEQLLSLIASKATKSKQHTNQTSILPVLTPPGLLNEASEILNPRAPDKSEAIVLDGDENGFQEVTEQDISKSSHSGEFPSKADNKLWESEPVFFPVGSRQLVSTEQHRVLPQVHSSRPAKPGSEYPLPNLPHDHISGDVRSTNHIVSLLTKDNEEEFHSEVAPVDLPHSNSSSIPFSWSRSPSPQRQNAPTPHESTQPDSSHDWEILISGSESEDVSPSPPGEMSLPPDSSALTTQDKQNDFDMDQEYKDTSKSPTPLERSLSDGLHQLSPASLPIVDLDALVMEEDQPTCEEAPGTPVSEEPEDSKLHQTQVHKLRAITDHDMPDAISDLSQSFLMDSNGMGSDLVDVDMRTFTSPVARLTPIRSKINTPSEMRMQTPSNSANITEGTVSGNHASQPMFKPEFKGDVPRHLEESAKDQGFGPPNNVAPQFLHSSVAQNSHLTVQVKETPIQQRNAAGETEDSMYHGAGQSSSQLHGLDLGALNSSDSTKIVPGTYEPPQSSRSPLKAQANLDEPIEIDTFSEEDDGLLQTQIRQEPYHRPVADSSEIHSKRARRHSDPSPSKIREKKRKLHPPHATRFDFGFSQEPEPSQEPGARILEGRKREIENARRLRDAETRQVHDDWPPLDSDMLGDFAIEPEQSGMIDASEAPATAELASTPTFNENTNDQKSPRNLSASQAKKQQRINKRKRAKTSPSLGSDYPIYVRFMQTYQEYGGDISHFLGMCHMINEYDQAQSMQHKSLWDDFIIRHWTEYIPFAQSRMQNGQETDRYEKYYRMNVHNPEQKQGVMNHKRLEEMLRTEAVFKDNAGESSPSQRHHDSAQRQSFMRRGQNSTVKSGLSASQLANETSHTHNSPQGISRRVRQGNRKDRKRNREMNSLPSSSVFGDSRTYSTHQDIAEVEGTNMASPLDLPTKEGLEGEETTMPRNEFLKSYANLKSVKSRLGMKVVEDSLQSPESNIDILSWGLGDGTSSGQV